MVVGRSPLLLVITFLAILGLWLGFSVDRVIRTAGPRAMVLLVSLPPINALLDLNFLVGGRTVSQAQRLASSFGLVLVRAALMSVWISLILESLQRDPSLIRVRFALLRAVRSYISMLGVEVGFLVGTEILSLVVASFLGPFGLVIVLGAVLYFFAYAPVIAVAEGMGTVRAAQLSVRAARVPGRQHMLLVTTYLALALFVAVVSPGSRAAAATPSVAEWAFALFVGYLHVSVLAALAYRWPLIRGHALAAAAQGKQRASSRA
jgi:hypothetical protein